MHRLARQDHAERAEDHHRREQPEGTSRPGDQRHRVIGRPLSPGRPLSRPWPAPCGPGSPWFGTGGVQPLMSPARSSGLPVAGRPRKYACSSSPSRRSCGGCSIPGSSGAEQIVLLVDQLRPAVVGQLELVGHGQRPGRAGLDAQPAQDAAQVVDLVDAAVPLPRREALLVGVLRALDVDRVRRAGPGAQLAADALLQPVGPAVQLVTTVEPRGGHLRPVRVLLGEGLAEHRLEGDAEPGDRVEDTHQAAPLGFARSSVARRPVASRGAPWCGVLRHLRSSPTSSPASSGSSWSPMRRHRIAAGEGVERAVGLQLGAARRPRLPPTKVSTISATRMIAGDRPRRSVVENQPSRVAEPRTRPRPSVQTSEIGISQLPAEAA